MKRVIIESPYQGDIERNVRYAQACMHECLMHGESPLASHLLYPQVLNDRIPFERELGIEAGFARWCAADLFDFYIDLGWSPGMRAAFQLVKREHLSYEIRKLKGWSNHESTRQPKPAHDVRPTVRSGVERRRPSARARAPGVLESA